MSQNSWFEHFKEQLQGLTEAYESSGTSLTLLGYALQEKRLSSEEYLKWAVTQYKLPRLQSRFFTETPLSQEMFAKWATHYRWSLECLPVAEWDGSLIVACLQPPQDFPHFPTSVLVLTTAEDLQNSWDYFHPAKAETVSQTAPASEAPEGIDLSSATKTTSQKEGFSFDDLGVTPDASSESTHSGIETGENQGGLAASADSEDIFGLLDTPTVVKLESLGGPLTSTSIPVTAAPVSEKTVVLEKTAPGNTFAGLAPTTSPLIPPPPIRSAPSLGTPPPPPKVVEQIPSEDSFSNRPMPLVTKPGGVARPTVNPVASGNFALEKLKKKNAILTEKIKVTLSGMKVHFDKSMILTLDDQESQVVAFAWDENFKEIRDTNMRFPLKTPSIFNIVVSTQKPYHGYISLNETNERFFDDWNQGVVPDHVTITPMIMNDKIVGLLVGFADKTAYNKVSLGLAEKLSNEFIKGLQAA